MEGGKRRGGEGRGGKGPQPHPPQYIQNGTHSGPGARRTPVSIDVQNGLDVFWEIRNVRDHATRDLQTMRFLEPSLCCLWGGIFGSAHRAPSHSPTPPSPQVTKKYPPATRPICRGRATQGWMNSWDGALVGQNWHRIPRRGARDPLDHQAASPMHHRRPRPRRGIRQPSCGA